MQEKGNNFQGIKSPPKDLVNCYNFRFLVYLKEPSQGSRIGCQTTKLDDLNVNG